MALELRNLENTYYRQSTSRRKSLYYDDINNNLIIFHPVDRDCDVDSICDGINNQAYSYLINELNSKENVVVYWSQVSGTTSGYTVYYDFKFRELINKSFKEIIHKLSKQENVCGMKYVEVKDGKAKAINFNSNVLH